MYYPLNGLIQRLKAESGSLTACAQRILFLRPATIFRPAQRPDPKAEA